MSGSILSSVFVAGISSSCEGFIGSLLGDCIFSPSFYNKSMEGGRSIMDRTEDSESSDGSPILPGRTNIEKRVC